MTTISRTRPKMSKDEQIRYVWVIINMRISVYGCYKHRAIIMELWVSADRRDEVEHHVRKSTLSHSLSQSNSLSLSRSLSLPLSLSRSLARSRCILLIGRPAYPSMPPTPPNRSQTARTSKYSVFRYAAKRLRPSTVTDIHTQ